jgi:hypothetical protein
VQQREKERYTVQSRWILSTGRQNRLETNGPRLAYCITRHLYLDFAVDTASSLGENVLLTRFNAGQLDNKSPDDTAFYASHVNPNLEMKYV